PRGLLYCDDVAILGAPFYLMERIQGIIIRRELPPGLEVAPAKARQLNESFIDNLARLHGLDYAAIGLSDLGKPEGYLERQVRGWIERYHGSKTHDISGVAQLSQWLPQNLPLSPPPSLIHNDYKFDNIVLSAGDPSRIIGLLDWEMCTIGDPISDLGTALAYWIDANDPEELQRFRWGPTSYPGSLTREALLERYAQQTGRDVSHIAFHLVFARFKL